MACEPCAEVEVRFFFERPDGEWPLIQDFWETGMLVSLNSPTFANGKRVQHLPVGIAL